MKEQTNERKKKMFGIVMFLTAKVRNELMGWVSKYHTSTCISQN